MRARRLHEKIRVTIIASPLIVGLGCPGLEGVSGGEPMDAGYDAGYDAGPPDSGPAFPPDCSSPAENGFPRVHGTHTFPITPFDGGWTDCATWCQAKLVCATWDTLESCGFATLADGQPAVTCTGTVQCGCTGRRPRSLRGSAHARSRTAVGAYFAEAARLEAASIEAFEILAGELAHRRAPSHLVRRARRSAHDEIRHAHVTAALAHRYGAVPTAPKLGPRPAGRTLEEFATENAVEGCVRETYGAVLAHWQARHARDLKVAAALTTIAADETRHAELAWDVAEWTRPQLSRPARSRIQDAFASALADLEREVALPQAASLVDRAGLPPPETGAILLSKLAMKLSPPA